MSSKDTAVEKKEKKKVKYDEDDDIDAVEYVSADEKPEPDKKLSKSSKIKEKVKEKQKAKVKSSGFDSDEVEVEELKNEVRFHVINNMLLKFQLDPKKKLCVSRYKGKLQVSIREYYEKDGEYLPTKKGDFKIRF